MDFGSRGNPRIRITMRTVEENANIAATSSLKMHPLYHTPCNQAKNPKGHITCTTFLGSGQNKTQPISLCR
jgi:hypothetical protein